MQGERKTESVIINPISETPTEPLSSDGEITDNILDRGTRLYIHEAGQHSLLTPDEEVELGEKIQQGQKAARKLRKLKPSDPDYNDLCIIQQQGMAARQKMIEMNLRLVVSCATQIARNMKGTMELLDLIQEGNVGLMTAVEKFNPGSGYRFSTYAVWWIRQAIYRARTNRGRTIRLPVHMHQRLQRFNEAELAFFQKHGRFPTNTEVATLMKLQESQVNDIRRAQLMIPLSLDSTVYEGNDGSITLADQIADTHQTTPEEYTIARARRHAIEKVLHTLTDREAKIIRLRFGLDDGKARTLEDVGQQLNISRERARQIEAEAIRKIRHPTRMQLLRDYADTTP